jgi:hypothetical protein
MGAWVEGGARNTVLFLVLVWELLVLGVLGMEVMIMLYRGARIRASLELIWDAKSYSWLKRS